LERLLITAQSQHTTIEFDKEIIGGIGEMSDVTDPCTELAQGRHVKHTMYGAGKVLWLTLCPTFAVAVRFESGEEVLLDHQQCLAELRVCLEAKRELAFLNEHMPLMRIQSVARSVDTRNYAQDLLAQWKVNDVIGNIFGMNLISLCKPAADPLQQLSGLLNLDSDVASTMQSIDVSMAGHMGMAQFIANDLTSPVATRLLWRAVLGHVSQFGNVVGFLTVPETESDAAPARNRTFPASTFGKRWTVRLWKNIERRAHHGSQKDSVKSVERWAAIMLQLYHEHKPTQRTEHGLLRLSLSGHHLSLFSGSVEGSLAAVGQQLGSVTEFAASTLMDGVAGVVHQIGAAGHGVASVGHTAIRRVIPTGSKLPHDMQNHKRHGGGHSISAGHPMQIAVDQASLDPPTSRYANYYHNGWHAPIPPSDQWLEENDSELTWQAADDFGGAGAWV
jgi:hypothetical protein